MSSTSPCRFECLAFFWDIDIPVGYSCFKFKNPIKNFRLSNQRSPMGLTLSPLVMGEKSCKIKCIECIYHQHINSASQVEASEISPLARPLPIQSIMASLPVVRHVASSAKSAIGLIHIQCHIKPGASKQREGIISVSDSVIEVCVSAQPRDGEANKAVRELFSDVCLIYFLLYSTV